MAASVVKFCAGGEGGYVCGVEVEEVGGAGCSC